MRKVLILLGSQSDAPLAEQGLEILRAFKISFELRIASAHRSPGFVEELVRGFEEQGGEVVVCVAGMPAHLAGAVAAMTNLPILAVAAPEAAGPDVSSSTGQMPDGIPIATMSLGKAGFVNAALFACQILARADEGLYRELQLYRQTQNAHVREADAAHRVLFDG